MAPVLLVLALSIMAALFVVAGVAVLFGWGWALIATGAACAIGATMFGRGLKANG